MGTATAARRAAPKKPATPAASSQPALKKGEIYRGVTLHEGKAAHLIQLPGEFSGTHADALKWAKEQGGELPSRIDGIVLFDGAQKDFQRDWYWLAPQLAGNPDFAWCQGFGYGLQGWGGRSGRSRAVAVRRAPIQ